MKHLRKTLAALTLSLSFACHAQQGKSGATATGEQTGPLAATDGILTAKRVGSLYLSDRYPGTDIGQKVNASIADAMENHAVASSRGLPLRGSIMRQINVGFHKRLYITGTPTANRLPCSAVLSDGLEAFDTSVRPKQQWHCLNGAWSKVNTEFGDDALGPVVWEVPQDAVWSLGISGQPTASGIVLYNNVTVDGQANAGGGSPMRIYADKGTYDSILRTDPNCGFEPDYTPTGDGGCYQRLSGISLNGTGAALAATFRWDDLVDTSSADHIFVSNVDGVAVHAVRNCCGTYINAFNFWGQYGANRSLPYEGDTPLLMNGSINAAGNGQPNFRAYSEDKYGKPQTIGHHMLVVNGYLETNSDQSSDKTTAVIDNSTYVDPTSGFAVGFIGGGPNNLSTKPLYKNPVAPFGVSLLFQRGNNFINDLRTGQNFGFGDMNARYDRIRGNEPAIREGQIGVGHLRFSAPRSGCWSVYNGALMQGSFTLQSGYGDQEIEGFLTSGKYSDSPPEITIGQPGFVTGKGEMNITSIVAGYDAHGKNTLLVCVAAPGIPFSLNLFGQSMDSANILTKPSPMDPNKLANSKTLKVDGGLKDVGVVSTGTVVGSRMRTTLATPATSSDSCIAGDAWDDTNYHYVCVANNKIKRVSLSAF